MALFLRILEWADDSKDTLVYKLPLEKGGREINHKSKLIVRESQQAIFVHKGQKPRIKGTEKTLNQRPTEELTFLGG